MRSFTNFEQAKNLPVTDLQPFCISVCLGTLKLAGSWEPKNQFGKLTHILLPIMSETGIPQTNYKTPHPKPPQTLHSSSSPKQL